MIVPTTCAREGCELLPAIGVAPLDGPTVWLCREHVGPYLEAVAGFVEAITVAARSSS